MSYGFPKPDPKPKKPPKPLKRTELKRSAKKIVGKYQRPEYLALARKVKKRAKGMCEEPGCTLPGEQVHHAEYSGRGRSVKNLLVDIEHLRLLCFHHHQAQHGHTLRR